MIVPLSTKFKGYHFQFLIKDADRYGLKPNTAALLNAVKIVDRKRLIATKKLKKRLNPALLKKLKQAIQQFLFH